MESGRKGFRPRPPHLLYPYVLLGLFAIALGYAAFKTGGVEFSDWNLSLLLVGIAAVLYLLRTRYLPPAPSSSPWLAWTALLLPAYIAFQLLPLPVWLLRLLSPERARLLDNLAPLMPPPGFTAISVNPSVTASFLLTFLAYVVVFLLIRDIASRTAPALPLLLIGTVEAIIGLLQATGGGEVQGTYGSFDHFAGLLEMALPLAVAYGMAALGPRLSNALKACAAFLSATLILLAVLYSTSRMGVIATLSSLLVMGLLKARKKTLVIVAILLVVVCLFPDTLIARFGGLQLAKESRLPIWADTLRLIKSYPLVGCGLGNYGTAFLKYQTTDVHEDYNYAHNDFLQFGSELGIVGFSILATLMIAIFINAARNAKSQYLSLGCTGAMIAIGLHSLADFNMYIPANAFVLAWISGMSAGGLPQPILLRRFTMAISCLLLAGASAWMLVKPPKQDLLQALSGDPAAALRWCDLGDEMLKSRNFVKARYCFSKALTLAPDIPPVLLRAATFFNAIHENKNALQQAKLILQKTDAEDDTVFDWYNDKKIPVTETLRDGMPAPRSYLRYLMNLGSVDDAAAVWNSFKPDEPIAIEYTNFLYGREQYESAAQAWARFLGKHEWIYNGDFEKEPSTSRFDWTIEKLAGVEVTRDTTVVHTGTHSLRIQFDGKENLTYNHVSQTTFVQPGDYKFQAYIRCQNITPDQGIGFHIVDPETPTRIDVKTDWLSGTLDWTKTEQIITVPPGTRLLQIQIIRQPSWRLFNNNTTGAIWIDGVKLIKLN